MSGEAKKKKQFAGKGGKGKKDLELNGISVTGEGLQLKKNICPKFS